MQKYSILLVGAGSMGGSLLSYWLDAGLVDLEKSAVVDPSPNERIARKIEEHGLALNPVEDQSYDLCVLAVKPQMLPTVIPTLNWPGIEKTCFVSVAAGQTISAIGTMLKEIGCDAAPVIRTIPNLPVSVGKGATVLYAEDNVAKQPRDAAFALMAAAGSAYWVASEHELDVCMSVASCGPAYIFLLTEVMEAAGIAAGLPKELAAGLARETVIGSASLMEADDRRPEELRAAVTSKGGTTAAALSVLNGENAFGPLMKDAIVAATKRAKELSN